MKTIKILLAVLLCMSLLTACAMPNLSDFLPDEGDTAGTVHGGESSLEEESEEEKPSRAYPKNFLADFSEEDDAEDPAFGGKLSRKNVTKVTFLDTLAGMPDSAWDVSKDGDGSVMAWIKNKTEIVIAGEGGVTPSTCKRLFKDFWNVTEIEFNDCFYTDHSTSMQAMFYDCWELKAIDASFFNTENVRTMMSMFDGCGEVKELDLSTFDTSKVTDMSHMFFGCESLTELDISTFDTSNVQYFKGTFNCLELPELDVTHFNTSNAVDMSGMFYGCYTLSELDLSNFDTSNVTDMCQMFMYCKGLTELDLSMFNTANVTRMGAMFAHARALKTVDFTGFNTSACTDFGYMFGDCPSLETLDLSGFDFSNAEDANEMFLDCANLTDIGCEITLPASCEDEDMYKGCGLK